MAKVFDRVGQSTATTGTGTVTLGAVITDSTNGDFTTFTDMGAIAGDSVNYLIVDGNNWELGIGSLGGTGPGFTLTRAVSKSKISGTAGTTLLTLSGTAKVYSVPSLSTNTWEFANATNPQTVYIYGTNSGGSANYSRLKLTQASGGGATIATEALGTGTAGGFTFSAGGTNVLDYGVTAAARWTASGTIAAPFMSLLNGGDFNQYDGSGNVAQKLGYYGIYTNASAVIRFSNSSTNGGAGQTNDTGISRNAAGVVEINNGTAGTFRDLIARNVRTSATTVASLVAAATAGAGARSFVTDATATHAAAVGTIVAGSGTNKVPVYSDGTNWLIG